MRISLSIFFVLIVSFVAAWTTEDQEIFQINHDVKQDLGEDTTFYSWLGLDKGPKSSFEEISKAYRKLSRRIHPDKVKPGKYASTKKYQLAKKKATQRFQRLGVVGEILRSSKKDRYDFYLKSGFPKYKKNGWLYTKFRPSVAMVFIGLFLLVGVFQYGLSKLQHNQNRKRIEQTVEQIRRQAWPSGAPLSGQDRIMSNEMTGKTFVVKVDGRVYIQDERDRTILHHLDPDDCVEPSIFDTVIFKAPIGLWNKSIGALIPQIRITPPAKLAPSQKKITEVKSESTEYKGKHKVKKNRADKGEKTTLPNGKVVYGRKKN